MSLPLNGVRVADFSRVLAGPYCSMLLADLGADVVKVESPQGDETRTWGPPYAGGESAYYLSVNRNKRSVTLDLKKPEDRALAFELLKQSDVLLHNFKSGDDVKLGLERSSVKKLNPTIVYAHISGYGSTGPEANKPGYDLLAQALTGLMSITGPPEGEPHKVGVAVVDVLAGLNAALGIVASLYAQKESPQFREVETSLLEAGLSSLVNVASSYLITGKTPERYGNAHASIVPYQAFQAQDEVFVVAAANDRQFEALAKTLERDEWLANEAFATNAARVSHRAVLVPLLEGVFKTQPRAHWLNLLETAGVPCAPVATLPEVFGSEQVRALDMVQYCEQPSTGDLPLVAGGFKLDGQPTPLYRPPPLLGEHTGEVVEELRGGLEAD
ncbi:CoA transferase [soil metagenome]